MFLSVVDGMHFVVRTITHARNCDSLDIVSAWKLGELDSLKLLKLFNDYFSKLEGTRVTMIHPNKRLVDVNVDTERKEVHDVFCRRASRSQFKERQIFQNGVIFEHL